MNTEIEITKDNDIQNRRLSAAERRILRSEHEAYEYLRQEALFALGEFKRCVNNFDFISEEKLVDVCIYDIQKSMSRYEYLVKELKRIKNSSV